MHNELFSIGKYTVYAYGLLIGIGVISAYFSAIYRAKKIGLDSAPIDMLAIWCLLGGALGAKLLYWITQLENIIQNPALLLNVSEGFVLYGGVIGGIFTGYLYCKFKKISFIKYFDLVMPSVALAQGFGRLGCFMAGCCYGTTSNWFWGITFPAGSLAPSGVPLVPTQLISSVLDFALFFILAFYAKRKKADGQVAALYLILYGIGRFVLEFFRGDLIRGNVGTLSTSQFISLFVFAAGLVLLLAKQFGWFKFLSTTKKSGAEGNTPQVTDNKSSEQSENSKDNNELE